MNSPCFFDKLGTFQFWDLTAPLRIAIFKKPAHTSQTKVLRRIVRHKSVFCISNLGLFGHVANLVAQLIARYRLIRGLKREIQREGGSKHIQGSQLSVRAPIPGGDRRFEPLQPHMLTSKRFYRGVDLICHASPISETK